MGCNPTLSRRKRVRVRGGNNSAMSRSSMCAGEVYEVNMCLTERIRFYGRTVMFTGVETVAMPFSLVALAVNV
jgi:hypothetical protein